MKLKLFVAALSALFLAACNPMAQLDKGESTIIEFHETYNEGNAQALYGLTSDEFRGATTPEQMQALVDLVTERMGAVESTEREGFNINTNNGLTETTVTMKTQFAKGEGTETFTFYGSGDDMRLVGDKVRAACDGLDGGFGVVGAADRAADHQNAGTVIARRARRYRTLLVAERGASGTQAGDDEVAVLPLFADLTHFLTGAHDPVETCVMRKLGKAHYMVVRRAADAGALEICFIEAGEHRHGDHLAAFSRSRFGILHHRAPAAGVDGDDGRLIHVDRLHRAGDGVGDVVQLQVEEDRQAHVRDFVHAVAAMRAEELKSQLDPADMRFDLVQQRFGRLDLGHVEREVDGVAHAGVLSEDGVRLSPVSALVAAGVGTSRCASAFDLIEFSRLRMRRLRLHFTLR